MTDNGRALGVAFPPMEVRRDVLVRSAIRAEELGYDGFFVAEAWGLDAFALLAEIATRTERILLGPAIVNVWSRSAATLAMSAATLSAISSGRFVLGLGASTRQLVEGLHDMAYSSPLPPLTSWTGPSTVPARCWPARLPGRRKSLAREVVGAIVRR